jgi:hypothetical protein
MPEGMFRLKLPKKVNAGSTEKGKIEILKDYLPQEFEKSITIELNDKALSRFTIPVKRQIRVLGEKSEEQQSEKHP